MSKEILEFTLVYHRETEFALLVSETEDSIKIWLPKSQVQVENVETDRYGTCTLEIEIPEWLAEKKELI